MKTKKTSLTEYSQETKAEKREAKKRNARKMKISGSSVKALEKISARKK